MDALRLDAIQLDYPGRPGVLAAVDLALAPGRLLVVEGRSGSGKSSLLAIAAGLQTPSSGTVTVMGEAMDPSDPSQRAALRGKHIGLVFQHLHLLGELTVQENVELALRLAQVPKPEATSRARELLDYFDIAAIAGRRPAKVSGGEQQRTAIARSLALEPQLLLVDEPTSSLDEANARNVIGALKAAAQRGAAVLVASHDELLRKAGPRLRLAEGRLTSLQTPETRTP
ncbi:MAG TPA: ATP-binding cassette domain-containing protein [Candidatus Thermoplasmatota archaeon]|nr:ATP-binding cassette domain-containing protein [Candidatus Thermoplasmatota archaeon]